ncbi:hypothetical protein CR159_11530 [Pollutimonas subterranea]|uniref:Antitoxin Xre/MbcA/ParS-like toxin-binding domain-containing protein n=1 Tax=Pollutimonas subterranea TaxID=2045210 RepID=A0A2N4U3H4_9BURK|nr:hypothetical protein [Pollutimonas subterranea]PLC49566.1 hypothetical protein CR159_11530 [Pollutimonas subterranea]
MAHDHDSIALRSSAVNIGVAIVDTARKESDRSVQRLSSSLAQESGTADIQVARYALEMRTVLNSIEEAALQTVVDATPMRRAVASRASLESRAIEIVLNATEWYSAEEIGLKRNAQAKNPHGIVSRWHSEGKLFAIEREGKRFYPAYAFDEFWQPRPVIGDVISTLEGASPFRIASWFSSDCSYLGSRRPMDLVASQPDEVVAAAMDHAVGPVHG